MVWYAICWFNVNFKLALAIYDEGILINGEDLNNIKGADDAMVLADSLLGLQTLKLRTSEISQYHGLDRNREKTNDMIISKRIIINGQLAIHQKLIERSER